MNNQDKNTREKVISDQKIQNNQHNNEGEQTQEN